MLLVVQCSIFLDKKVIVAFFVI